MTLEQCYDNLHGNFANAMRCLRKEDRIKKYLHLFPSDTSMAKLNDAVQHDDTEAAIEAVHTLKGVVANMGFTELFNQASALTEQLRSKTQLPDPKLFAAVKDAYDTVIAAIEQYEKES